jgi:hypothetical protein
MMKAGDRVLFSPWRRRKITTDQDPGEEADLHSHDEHLTQRQPNPASVRQGNNSYDYARKGCEENAKTLKRKLTVPVIPSEDTKHRDHQHRQGLATPVIIWR